MERVISVIMKRNIYLIGFMGTGKSTVGKELARLSGKKFIDMDQALEQLEGMPVSQIFETQGEQYFREKELVLAKKLSRQSNRIIATGGGTFLNEEIRELFSNSGLIIQLYTEKDQLVNRLGRTDRRPLLKGDKSQLEGRVDRLMEERKNTYSGFSIRVDTTNLSPQEAAKKIISTLNSYQKILDRLHNQYITIK